MKSASRTALSAALWLTAILSLAAITFAQGIVTGTITGVVQDSAGAVIANAKVTATQVETNRVFTTQSSTAGVIQLRDLPIGTYNLAIESGGFRRFESRGVGVEVGKETSLGTVKMEIGSTAEAVTVEGTAPLVEATTDQISETFAAQKVTDLPMGNTFDSLALFVPGIVTAGDAGMSNNNGAELSVNGQRGRANNFQIDGQSNNDNSIGGPDIFFGNQDAISEIQVVTNYDAQFGRNTGAVVNYVTKAGTNQFHGSAFEIWDGATFDSMTNEDKNPLLGYCPPGVPANATTGCIAPSIPGSVENRFGGTVGGPIKRDRIWFFGSTNFDRLRTAGEPQSTGGGIVPTPTGVTQLEAAFPSSPIGLIESTIGPNAVTAGNPTFTNLTNVPVTVGTTTVPIQFGTLTRFVPSPFNDYEATGRVDFKLTDKDNFFARYVYQKQYNGGVNDGNGVDVGDYQFIPSLSQQIGLDWARTFSNAFVNQVRFSYFRASVFFQEQSFSSCNSVSPTACPTDMVLEGSAPQDSVSFGVAAGLPQGRVINVYQLQDNASILKGHHTIKFGAELDQQRSPNVFLPENNGVFVFPTFDSMVAGDPAVTQIALGSPTLPFTEWDLGAYVQDDWRIKPNLTLNLGMRWDWYQQAINLLHQKSMMQQTGAQPLWSTSLPLNETTVPTLPEQLHNFAPVLGFAWTPNIGGDDKTVFRGGFRIAYDPQFYNMFLNVATSAPEVNLATLSGTGLPTGGFYGTQVIPYLQPLAPTGNPGFADQTQVASNFHNPYSEQWNFGVQRSFRSNIVGEVRYVGNHGVGEFQALNGNPALGPLIAGGFSNVIPAGLTPCANPAAPGYANGNVNCSFSNVIEYANTASSNYNGLQSELRIGNWHGVSATGSYTWSHAIDNASEVFNTLGGGNTLAFAQNPFQTGGPERANSGTDFPNVATVAIVYALPFEKGQQGFKGHLLGGWEVNTTYRYTSGQPFTAIQNYPSNGSFCDPTAVWGGQHDACRPIVGNTSFPITSVGQYCDGTTATCLTQGGGAQPLGTLINFTDPCFGSAGGSTPCAVSPIQGAHWIHNDPIAAAYLGTPYAGVGRNTLRGQPISTANLSVFKNIKMTERLTGQLQVTAYNILNTQFLGVPNPILDTVADTVNGTPEFLNTGFNANGGGTFAGNTTTDGIAQRRLYFGFKLLF
jgi:hypothetical protein